MRGKIAGEVGVLAVAAVIDVELCAAFSISGDTELSITHGERAAEQALALGQQQVASIAFVVLTSSYVEVGKRERAAEASARARAISHSDPVIEGFLLLAVDGVSALLDERRDAALVAFDRGMTLLRDGPVSSPASMRGLWPLLLAVVHDPFAEIALGEVEASGVAVNRLNLGYLQLARLVLAGRHDPSAAEALAQQGFSNLAHSTLWRHLGQRLLAEAAAADGWGNAERGRPKPSNSSPSAGHPAIAAACRRIAERGSGRHWALAEVGVTRREADVFTLVREGLTNREIAERLFVSPRTVEKHIESLLRKTQARSRTQLATYEIRIGTDL